MAQLPEDIKRILEEAELDRDVVRVYFGGEWYTVPHEPLGDGVMKVDGFTFQTTDVQRSTIEDAIKAIASNKTFDATRPESDNKYNSLPKGWCVFSIFSQLGTVKVYKDFREQNIKIVATLYETKNVAYVQNWVIYTSDEIIIATSHEDCLGVETLEDLEALAMVRKREKGKFNAAIPEPIPNGQGGDIVDLVIQDYRDRARVGEKKYGQKLKAFNGSDALTDAYQESVDLTMYLRQLITERKSIQNVIVKRISYLKYILSPENAGYVSAQMDVLDEILAEIQLLTGEKEDVS